MMTQPTNGGRDLLAETSAPDGVAAACKHCTVPVDDGEVCGFCQSYTPPESVAQRLDVAVNKVDLLRHDLNEILRELPDDTPLMAIVDIVTALGLLRRATVSLDKATDAIGSKSSEDFDPRGSDATAVIQ